MGVTRRNALVLLTVLLFLGGLAWFFLWPVPPAVSERQQATWVLADYLQRTLSPEAVLVIGNPFAQLPGRPAAVYEFEKAGVSGIRAGLPEAVPVITAHPELAPGVIEEPSSVQVDPRSPTPLSFMVQSSAFDKVVQTHSEAEIVVSLIGLPVNLASFAAWTTSGPPRFALVFPDWRIIGDSAAIQGAFASGKLVAAVVNSPGSASRPGARHMLVHSNNITELLRDFPRIFTSR